MSKIRKKIEDIHFEKSGENVVVKILKPVSYIYNGIAKLRRDIYSKRLLKSRIAGCYTIAVGNLTYGGTGKTPVVISLAGMFSEKGLRVGIVHSGYGSPQHRKGKAKRITSECEGVEAGDEAVELFVRAKDALVYSSKDRVEAIERAIFEGGVNVCILDDAFQYMKIASDLKILVVDYFDLFGNEYCIPAGPMRESKKALTNADIIWFVSPREYSVDKGVEKEFLSINNKLKFVYSRFKPESLLRLSDMQKVNYATINSKVVSFCGIGRDNRFTEMLAQIGIVPAKHLSFGDHHRYKKRDVEIINEAAQKYSADVVITTEKDYLRDISILRSVNNLYILRISLEIISGRSTLEELFGSFV